MSIVLCYITSWVVVQEPRSLHCFNVPMEGHLIENENLMGINYIFARYDTLVFYAVVSSRIYNANHLWRNSFRHACVVSLCAFIGQQLELSLRQWLYACMCVCMCAGHNQ